MVDSDITRAKELAERYGAIATADKNIPLADTEVAAVIIASPTDTHADLIEASVAANKAILCEKPIDLNLERVRSCERVVEGFNKPIMIGFNRRFDDTHQAVQRAIQEGEIGSIESISIISRDPSPPTYDYLKTSGGQFSDQMIHDFDFALWLTGASDKVRVFAMGGALIDPKIGELDDTDSAHVLLEFASGIFCKIECSRRAIYGYDQRIEAFGALGVVSSGNQHTSAIDRWNASGTAARASLIPDFAQRYSSAYSAELEALLNVLEGGTFVGADFVAGRRALQLAEAARQSKRSGQVVVVDLSK